MRWYYGRTTSELFKGSHPRRTSLLICSDLQLFSRVISKVPFGAEVQGHLPNSGQRSDLLGRGPAQVAQDGFEHVETFRVVP